MVGPTFKYFNHFSKISPGYAPVGFLGGHLTGHSLYEHQLDEYPVWNTFAQF